MPNHLLNNFSSKLLFDQNADKWIKLLNSAAKGHAALSPPPHEGPANGVCVGVCVASWVGPQGARGEVRNRRRQGWGWGGGVGGGVVRVRRCGEVSVVQCGRCVAAGCCWGAVRGG
jgi:hypothetical protein